MHISYTDWKVFNAYWVSGIEARYFNFQNPDVLGSAADLSVFAEPLLMHRKKFLFSVRGGAGISYHSKIFDPVDNPLNMFFSSRISFPLYVNARFQYKMGERTFITLSGCYNHISNGGFKQPNKGMNFPTLAIGVERYKSTFPSLDHNYSSYPREESPSIFFTFEVLTSIKVLSKDEIFPEEPAFIYGFHTRVSKSLGYLYALNAGAEVIFDYYNKETIRREQKDLDYKRFAFTIGQDFLLGKVIFTQYFGIYVYSPYKARNPIYQKYELSYRIHKNFLIGVYQKAHMQVAELMGVSFNYQIPLHKISK